MAESTSPPSHSQEAAQHWQTAVQNMAKKLYNRAMLDLSEAIKLDRSYLEEAHKQFHRYLDTSQWEKTVAMGLGILRSEPKNYQLMNQVGNAYRHVKQAPKAVRMYQEALKLRPDYQHARYNLAGCQFNVMTFDEALVKQTRRVERFHVYRRMGYQRHYKDDIPTIKNQELPRQFVLQQHLEQQAEVEETDAEGAEIWIPRFEKQAQTHPDSWEVQFDLGVLYDVARFGELAIQAYEKAAQLSPQNTIIETNLGIAYAVYGEDLEKAKEMFQGIVKRERAHRITVLNLAILYRHLKKPFSMLKYFTYLGELLAKSHGLFNIQDMIVAADQYFEERLYTKAADLYQALLAEEDNPDWLYRIGVIHQKQREVKIAIDYWHRALSFDAAHEDSHTALQAYVDGLEAEAQELMDDNFLADAVSILEQAVAVYPLVGTCEMLADIYDEMGEQELADQFAAKAVSLAEEKRS